jgi:hypothetical protein
MRVQSLHRHCERLHRPKQSPGLVSGGTGLRACDPTERIRVYRWLNREPTDAQIQSYLNDVLGKRYDVAIYFWTSLQYILRHYFNRRIPRLLDDRYTCWENLCEFYEAMGKRIVSRFDCPMITDVLANLENACVASI